MQFNKILIVAFFSLILFVCCHTEQAENEQQPTDFHQFSEQFLETYWELNPTIATYNGYTKHNNQLPIPDEERKQYLIAQYQQLFNKLTQFNEEQLSDLDRVDYELIKNELESSIWYLEDFNSTVWNPAAYNLGGTFFYTLKGDESIEERLLNVNERLKKVPEYYEQAKLNIAEPVKEYTELAIQQIPSSLDVIKTAVLDSLKQAELSAEETSEIKENVQLAEQAITNYVQFVEDDLLASGNFRSFRIGEQQYKNKFQYDINSGLTAQENFEAALQAKEAVHQKMLELATELWPKYYGETTQPEGLEAVKQLIDTISTSHTTKEQFVNEVKQQVPQLEEFVKEKNLIEMNPDKPLVIRETPKYMRGFAGASVSAPGPYDKDGETYYNVTPIDDWEDDRAQSYLREYNDYMLQILNIHEAIPGHYTQLVYANESPSLIKSIFGNGAMIEGWACFSERVMLENGYGDGPTKDELMLMYYKWNLRIICNSIIDYGIHVKNWDREKVMDVLVNDAFQEKAEAEGKWKRARISSVQLTSYFNGLTEIQNLKNEIEQIQGGEFKIKEFNEEFLSYGSAPVRLIRELMLEKLNSKES